MSNIADKLNELVEVKSDIKAAIESKGVTPTGGLSTYADAIESIQQEIIVEGSNIDYTQIGWTVADAVKQNEIDKSITDIDIEYSKTVMEQFKDGFNTTLWKKLYPDIVYMPIVDLSSQTDLSEMFGGYSSYTKRPKLRVFPSMDMINVKDMGSMFENCSSLESVGLLTWCSSVYNVGSMFRYCNNLKHLGGFQHLGVNLHINHGSQLYCTLNLSDANQLTTTSVLNVFNTIATVSTSKKCQITLHADVLAKLTDDEIAIATNKGWTVS